MLPVIDYIVKRYFSYFGTDDSTSSSPTASSSSSSSSSTSSFSHSSTLLEESLSDSQTACETVTKPNVDWTVQAWLGSMSRTALCQIIWRMHQSTLPVTTSTSTSASTADKTIFDSLSADEDDRRELKTIQAEAGRIAHQLDAYRPSEQFVLAKSVVQELQQLVRMCPHMTQSPIAAIRALLSIVQECFTAPPEVRQHIFYQSKLGRWVVLELAAVLKSNDPPTDRDTDMAWIDQLEDVCARLARYDTTWEYRQEYANVVEIAERYYKVNDE
ncbi:hypothetical protein BCR43DRAFT_493024 [Syncephalastrum racemosum]|uniref:Uncharacterized protein n=1 Tax=Syncephalastrum racemosum TaxID=13706 RepID=A0A1X2H9U7_SYNRA|nr:hypothetical protein BCR43DRAFT_493024 [Syncephalastrum racemosum]